jgi:hypothetical protein
VSTNDDLNQHLMENMMKSEESTGLTPKEALALNDADNRVALWNAERDGRTGRAAPDEERADSVSRSHAVADALARLWSVYQESKGDVRTQMRFAMLALGNGPDEDEPGHGPIDDAAAGAVVEAPCYALDYLRAVSDRGLLAGLAQDTETRVASLHAAHDEEIEELRAEAKRAWSHVEQVATVLGCGTSAVQILMALTKTMADATRENEQARAERDEAIGQRDALRIERDALAAQVASYRGLLAAEGIGLAQGAQTRVASPDAAHAEEVEELKKTLAAAIGQRDALRIERDALAVQVVLLLREKAEVP